MQTGDSDFDKTALVALNISLESYSFFFALGLSHVKM